MTDNKFIDAFKRMLTMTLALIMVLGSVIPITTQEASAFSGKVGSKLLFFARLLYYILVSPSTPLKAKGIIIGALGYFILPLDLIPDLIPLVGFTDDLAAIMAVVGIVNRYSTPEIKAQARKNQ